MSRWHLLAWSVSARCWSGQIGTDGGSPVMLRFRFPNLPRRNLWNESGELSLTQLGDDILLDVE